MLPVEPIQPFPVYPVLADLGINQGRDSWVRRGVLSACGAGGENEQNGYDERWQEKGCQSLCCCHFFCLLSHLLIKIQPDAAVEHLHRLLQVPVPGEVRPGGVQHDVTHLLVQQDGRTVRVKQGGNILQLLPRHRIVINLSSIAQLDSMLCSDNPSSLTIMKLFIDRKSPSIFLQFWSDQPPDVLPSGILICTGGGHCELDTARL